jgi:hypothetical protein
MANNVVHLNDFRKSVLKDEPQANTDFWNQRHMPDIEAVVKVLMDSGWISPNATYEVGNTFYDIRINPPGGNTG